MKRQQTIMFCLAGGLSFLPLVCSALSDDNPYKSIVDRNAFDLASPPDPTTNAPAVVPSNIKLTGIVDIFDKKQALLLVQASPGKPEDSYILGEGERQEDVEVLAIDEAGGTVKVSNAGVISTLTFDKDGVSADSGPAPGPHGPPAVGNFINPRVGVHMIPPPPARNFRLPQAQNQPQENPQSQPYQQSQGYPQSQPFQQPQSYQQSPAIINPFAPQNQVQNQAQTPAQNEAVSPEVQAILIEKLRAEHANDPNYPPMPPTPLTPTENSDSSGQ